MLTVVKGVIWRGYRQDLPRSAGGCIAEPVSRAMARRAGGYRCPFVRSRRTCSVCTSRSGRSTESAVCSIPLPPDRSERRRRVPP